MLPDTDLLRSYSEDRSEAAFAELVRRHVDFVYSTALRQVGGNAHAAADVSQYVFTQVARKARALLHHRALKGWLYVTARRAAANVVRAERRRQSRQQQAHTMLEPNEPVPASPADDLRLVIDHALSALSSRDREAVLLRYFEDRAYSDVGARYGITADAARLRIERALEKMKTALARRGVASTTAALTGALTTQAAVVAPASLAGTVTGAALATAATGGGMITILSVMSMTKLQTGMIGAVLLAGAVGIGVVLQQRTDVTREGPVIVGQQARETDQTHAGNTRIVEAVTPAAAAGTDELARLRRENEALKQQLAAAAQIKLAPRMVAASQWKNAGRATPSEALETLLWAAENGDVRFVGKMVGCDERARQVADGIYSVMPDALRKAGNVTRVEEMIGLAWTMGAQLAGAEIVSAPQAEAESPDDVTIRARLQKNDGTIHMQEFPFQRTPDGWKWMLSHENLEFVGNGMDDFEKRIHEKK